MALTQLANALSDIVTTADGVRDALADAGLSGRYVAIEGSPYDMWTAALSFAETDGKLPVLCGVMRGRYPGNEKLFEAEREYWQARIATATRIGSGSGMGTAWESAWAQTNLRLMFVERTLTESRDTIERLVERREADWSRFMLLVGAAAGLGAFFTVVLSRLL